MLEARVAVAGHYGLSLRDVGTLAVWQFNHLADLMFQSKGISKDASTNKRPPEPGMTPVMT